jgi:YesN/AraC family two-component response regulator
MQKMGRKGLAKANEHNPSLIISDVMMPRLNGLEMTEILKNGQETSHIPVILLTSRSSEGHELEGLRTGADDYVAKPFNKEILLARIQNVFASREKWIRRVTKEMDFTAADVSIADTDKEFLGKVKTVVKANLSNSEFTTEILAGEVGMSRTLLFKKLKGLLDETGGSFILSMRMKAAAEYLTKSDYNISEICYMVGFSDPKYFTRVFRKYYNLTPTDYRDQKKDVN